MDYPCAANHYQATHAALLIDSYRRLLGKDLLPAGGDDTAEALFHAPIAVISHDLAADPVFNYGNLKALELFGMTWDEFTRMPSRFAAEAVERAEREILLATVKAQGFVYPFQGVRITKAGQRFTVKDGAVWNLLDADGRYCGQAACFFAWEIMQSL